MDCRIGWLTEHCDGVLAGALHTLTIRDQIELRPENRPAGGQQPERYMVLIGSGAPMGTAYRCELAIRIELHSPELSSSIQALAVPASEPGEWFVIWSTE